MTRQARSETYKAAYRVRSGIAHGGIGAGFVELRKDGDFYNWLFLNNRPKGVGPLLRLPGAPEIAYDIDRRESFLFFVVRYRERGGQPRLKLLKINNGVDEANVATYSPLFIFPWLTPIDTIEYTARFPFSTLRFTDPDMPLEISMTAVSPFIPHDIKHSSLPGVYFSFSVKSLSDRPVDVTLVATLRNLVGYDTQDKYWVSSLRRDDRYVFFDHSAGGIDERRTSFGHMGLASRSPDSTWYLGWEHPHPYYDYLLRHRDLPNLDDTDGRVGWEGPQLDNPDLTWLPNGPGRNEVDPGTGEKRVCRPPKRLREDFEQRQFSSLARSWTLEKGAEVGHDFVMSWFFPNHYPATGSARDATINELIDRGRPEGLPRNHGHYYARFFENAADVAGYLVRHREELLGRTRRFVDDFYASDAEPFVLDQVNSHLNTLITNTSLDREGRFSIADDLNLVNVVRGAGWGQNPDVGIYGSGMTAALFPELQRSAMRGVLARQRESGMVGSPRSDWPGDIVNAVVRDYLWTGDTAYARELWPRLKRVVEYALRELDVDDDGVPEIFAETDGCSYDNLPLYGTTPYIVSNWIVAMTAMVAVAGDLGDSEAAERYGTVLEQARDVMEKKLWNGEYYRLFNDTVKGHGANEGCMTDQLFSQFVAHQCGLGRLADKEKIASSLRAIVARNFTPGEWLMNCTWRPQGELGPIEPEVWVDQASTPWSGVELAFAALLLYEGFYDDALSIVQAVDRRYRRARLYFSHQEAGGHYLRPCAAWLLLNGLLGLSIRRGVYSFSPKLPKDRFTLFFAAPDGTAHFVKEPATVSLKVCSGELAVKECVFARCGLETGRVSVHGVPGEAADVAFEEGRTVVRFERTVRFAEGDVLTVSVKRG